MPIDEIKGTFHFADGREHSFSIIAGLGWQQWGGITAQLGETCDLLDALESAALESEDFGQGEEE